MIGKWIRALRYQQWCIDVTMIHSRWWWMTLSLCEDRRTSCHSNDACKITGKVKVRMTFLSCINCCHLLQTMVLGCLGLALPLCPWQTPSTVPLPSHKTSWYRRDEVVMQRLVSSLPSPLRPTPNSSSLNSRIELLASSISHHRKRRVVTSQGSIVDFHRCCSLRHNQIPKMTTKILLSLKRSLKILQRERPISSF